MKSGNFLARLFSLMINIIMGYGIQAQMLYEVIDLGATHEIRGDQFASSINEYGLIAGWKSASGGLIWELGDTTYLKAGGAYSINDLGWVSGGGPIAYIWKDGFATELGTLGGNSSYAYSINNKGWAVGESETDISNLNVAFIYRNGNMIEIEAGDWKSVANDLNENGRVVGSMNPTEGDAHAFMWENGLLYDLGAISGNSEAHGINDYGNIVGQTDTAYGTQHAFLFEGNFNGGVMYDMGTLPDGDRSMAYDINNNGIIIGQSSSVTTGLIGCIWINREIYNLNDLIINPGTWRIDKPYGINDRGWIVGTCTIDYQERMCLLRPVDLLIFDPVPGLAGMNNEFRIEGGIPGDKVVFMYGTQCGWSEIVGCTGISTRFLNPKTIGKAIVDTEGVAVLNVFVPLSASGSNTLIQAVQISNCGTSQMTRCVFK